MSCPILFSRIDYTETGLQLPGLIPRILVKLLDSENGCNMSIHFVLKLTTEAHANQWFDKSLAQSGRRGASSTRRILPRSTSSRLSQQPRLPCQLPLRIAAVWKLNYVSGSISSKMLLCPRSFILLRPLFGFLLRPSSVTQVFFNFSIF